MTKKDYILIADAINRTHKIYTDILVRSALGVLVNDLSGELKRDNPNFKRDTFVDRCFKQ